MNRIRLKIQLIERILRLYKYIESVQKTLRVLYAGSRVDVVSTDVRVERPMLESNVNPMNNPASNAVNVQCWAEMRWWCWLFKTKSRLVVRDHESASRVFFGLRVKLPSKKAESFQIIFPFNNLKLDSLFLPPIPTVNVSAIYSNQ